MAVSRVLGAAEMCVVLSRRARWASVSASLLASCVASGAVASNWMTVAAVQRRFLQAGGVRMVVMAVALVAAVVVDVFVAAGAVTGSVAEGQAVEVLAGR